ncbi:MAG: A24 family peptidase [Planctomycetota bacterium]|nr:A24 family peptidase [Planctomycetota bacterium]
MFSWFHCLMLSLAGAGAGAAVNWGIYNLAWNRRFISPWGSLPTNLSRRSVFSRIPIVGWLLLRGESNLHGQRFWLRPCCIEIGCGFAFALFYYCSCNLIDQLLHEGFLLPESLLWVQLIPHLILLVWLLTATFIDIDERLIPDTITVTGTLIAITLAARFPHLRLVDLGNPSTEIVFLVPSAPSPPSSDLLSIQSLLLAWGLFGFWGLAVLPKLCTVRYGLIRGLQLMIASVVRPARKSRKPGTPRKRKPFAISAILMASVVLGWIGIYGVWSLGGEHWESLHASIQGMTGGLCVVWGVRIVGRIAMGREVMGFGDATLLAMIGAFLGWQPALLTFFLAPFAGMIITALQFLSTRRSDLAFGPYLSLSAVMVVLCWPTVWQDYARDRVFIFGSALPIVLLVGLAMMGGMLFFWQQLKNRYVQQ